MSVSSHDMCIVCSKTIKHCHKDINCSKCQMHGHKKCKSVKLKLREFLKSVNNGLVINVYQQLIKLMMITFKILTMHAICCSTLSMNLLWIWQKKIKDKCLNPFRYESIAKK